MFNKAKFLGDKNSDLQTEIEHISSKSTLHIRRVRELEAVNSSLEKQLQESESSGLHEARERTQQEVKEEKTKTELIRK